MTGGGGGGGAAVGGGGGGAEVGRGAGGGVAAATRARAGAQGRRELARRCACRAASRRGRTAGAAPAEGRTRRPFDAPSCTRRRSGAGAVRRPPSARRPAAAAGALGGLVGAGSAGVGPTAATFVGRRPLRRVGGKHGDDGQAHRGAQADAEYASRAGFVRPLPLGRPRRRPPRRWGVDSRGRRSRRGRVGSAGAGLSGATLSQAREPFGLARGCRFVRVRHQSSEPPLCSPPLCASVGCARRRARRRRGRRSSLVLVVARVSCNVVDCAVGAGRHHRRCRRHRGRGR